MFAIVHLFLSPDPSGNSILYCRRSAVPPKGFSFDLASSGNLRYDPIIKVWGNNHSMHIVTGGAGFIGSNIVQALCERGESVVVCDQFGSGEKWRNISSCVVHDIITPVALTDYLDRHGSHVKSIVHMGAISSTTESDVDLIIANNLRLSIDLWDWCTAHRVAYIYASSAATYGDGSQGFDDDSTIQGLAKLQPLNAYGWSKHAFDRRTARLLAAGSPCPPQHVGLKFFNVYGPNELHKGSMMSVAARAYPTAAQGKPVRLFKSHRNGYADGEQLRDFIYVKDCVAVILWLLDHPHVSGLFNVGTGKARSFADLAKAVFRAVGKPVDIQFIDMPESLREKYQYFTEAKMDRLRRAGFEQPFHSVEDGVRDYVNSYLSRVDASLLARS